MTGDQKEPLLECSQRTWFRIAIPIILIILAITILRDSFSTGMNVLIIVFFVFGFLSSYAYSPDIAIHEDGLEIKTLFGKYFVRWDGVKGVLKAGYSTAIYLDVAELNKAARFGIGYPFRLEIWRKHYDESVLLIKDKVDENRYIETL